MVRYFTFLLFPFLFISGNLATAQTWGWASAIGNTTGHTVISAMHRYSDAEILIAGGYGSRTLNFGEEFLTNKGQSNVFAALIDSSGNHLWAIGFGGKMEDRATAVASDKNSNIYIAGNFSSLSMKTGAVTLINKGETDGFLVKINAQKEVAWAMSFGGILIDEISGVATDSDGNIYVSGHTIDYQNALFTLFVIKIDASKNIIWERTATTPGWNTRSTSLVVDKDDNIYLAGRFSDTLTFGKNQIITSSQGGEEPYMYFEENGFIAKYNSMGNFVNAKAIKNFSKVNAMTAHASYIYVCGEKNNYGMGWGWPLLDSKIFTSKYNNNLEPVWEKSTGGLSSLQSWDIAKAISADPQGNVYVTGSFFSEKIDFGGQTMKNILNKDYYYQMAFVLKYNSQGDEVWGKAIGDNLCDNGNAITAVGNDRFFLAGTYESSKIRFGNHTLENNGVLKEVYVHLRPARQSRNTFSFVALQKEFGTAIKPINNSNAVKIFPNPAIHNFTVSLIQNQTLGGEITIYAHDGRLMQSQIVASGEQHIKVDVENLNSGIYMVKVKTGNHVSVQKLVKK